MAVEGVEKLMRQFNQLGSMEPVVYKSVKRQAEVVRGVAVKLCPVYSPKGDSIPGVSSGELRGSIYTKVSQDANTTIGSVYTNKEYCSICGIWHRAGWSFQPSRHISECCGDIHTEGLGVAGCRWRIPCDRRTTGTAFYVSGTQNNGEPCNKGNSG